MIDLQKKHEKGITLVALAITIIVLVILAGVAINLTVGENGIFSKAKYAREEYLNAEIFEKENLNDLVDKLGEEKIVKEISLNKMSTTLYVGESESLHVIIIPEDATNREIEWSSSNTNVATVENGIIQALAEGTTIITANVKGKSEINTTCEVIVEENIVDVNSKESMIKLCNSSTEKISQKLSEGSFRNKIFLSDVFKDALLEIGKEANIVKVIKLNNKYKEEISSLLEDNWNEKLNTIAYWCETNCWLYHTGNFCNGITGGWGYTEKLINYGQSSINLNNSEYMEINAIAGTEGRAGSIHTINKISMGAYKKIVFNFNISNAGSSACGSYGIASSIATTWVNGYVKSYSWNYNNVTGTVTKELSIEENNEEYYAQIQAFQNVMKVYNVRLYAD